MTSREEGGPEIINIAGALIALGPLRRYPLPLYLRWVNSPITARDLGMTPPLRMEQEIAWHEHTAVSREEGGFHRVRA